MAARSGVLAPCVLAAAAAGGRVPPSVIRASRAASTVMVARRTAPARSDRIQLLLAEMLVVTVWLLCRGPLVGGRDWARGLDDRQRGRSRRRPAGHSSASSPGRMHPTAVTLGMTLSGEHGVSEARCHPGAHGDLTAVRRGPRPRGPRHDAGLRGNEG